MTFTAYEEKLFSLLFNKESYSQIALGGESSKTLKVSNLILLVSGISKIDVFFENWDTINENLVFRNNLYRIIKLLGVVHWCETLLKNRKSFLCFNDHSIYHRGAYLVANKNYLKTIYVQHAPVNSSFPELYFDLNILFSEHSKMSYRNPDGKKVFLAYDIRLKGLIGEIGNPNQTLNKNVLICINDIDSILEIKKTISKLQKENFKVKIRPHPLQKDYYRKIFGSALVSDNDNIIDDLRDCRKVVLNETSVVLEAVFLGANVFKASFFSSLDVHDNYDFIKYGLITKDYFDLEKLVNAVKTNEKSVDKNMLNFFCGVNKTSEMPHVDMELYKVITD